MTIPSISGSPIPATGGGAAPQYLYQIAANVSTQAKALTQQYGSILSNFSNYEIDITGNGDWQPLDANQAASLQERLSDLVDAQGFASPDPIVSGGTAARNAALNDPAQFVQAVQNFAQSMSGQMTTNSQIAGLYNFINTGLNKTLTAEQKSQIDPVTISDFKQLQKQLLFSLNQSKSTLNNRLASTSADLSRIRPMTASAADANHHTGILNKASSDLSELQRTIDLMSGNATLTQTEKARFAELSTRVSTLANAPIFATPATIISDPAQKADVFSSPDKLLEFFYNFVQSAHDNNTPLSIAQIKGLHKTVLEGINQFSSEQLSTTNGQQLQQIARGLDQTIGRMTPPNLATEIANLQAELQQSTTPSLPTTLGPIVLGPLPPPVWPPALPPGFPVQPGTPQVGVTPVPPGTFPGLPNTLDPSVLLRLINGGNLPTQPAIPIVYTPTSGWQSLARPSTPNLITRI